jgi:hypothetical protein
MRRVLAMAATAVVLVAALVVLVMVFAARDDAQVTSQTAAGPGTLEPDRGAAHDGRAEVPAGELPTSGTHRPDLITRDRRRLTDDQIIHALELGDVVLAYEGARPDPALVRLQDELAGAFDAELSAAGQAVVLARRPGAGRVTALAWRRLLRADDPRDPRLREFADAWLGRGR